MENHSLTCSLRDGEMSDELESRRWALTPLIPIELVPAICNLEEPAEAAAWRGKKAAMLWCFFQSPKAAVT